MGQKDVKVGKRGRPRIILNRDAAQFIRTFRKLRDDGQNPTVKTVMEESGMTRGSYRSFVRVLNTAGYKKLQPRKKGLLSKKDKYMRKVFAKQSLSQFTDDFWRDRVAFYLDAVSFVHKYNQLREASKPRGKVWRKWSEGLQYTTTGSKDLAGGRRVHFLVTIAYHGGVIVAEPYEKMTGEYFANFVARKLPQAFINARMSSRSSRIQKVFVMDNDPCQNSKVAWEALKDIGATLLRIPPRSPDLNPIENIFNNVKRALQEEALRKTITYEPYNSFLQRVSNALLCVNGDLIKKTIDTIPKRLRCIVETRGNRTKY